MEITSDVYGDNKIGERTSEFNPYDTFCTITVVEGPSGKEGIINAFNLRLNTNRTNDLLLLLQLRSNIEKALIFFMDSRSIQ